MAKEAEAEASKGIGTSDHLAGQPTGPAITVGGAMCEAAQPIGDNDPDTNDPTFCNGDSQPPTVTVADAQEAFGRLPLEAGVLMIEPPDHVTLVNFDTNFYTTTTEPVSRPMTLLDQAVTLEATPSQYTWTFGDGQSLTTTIPGAPYPRLDVTHNYLLKGDYLPSLSTTYTGRFKVGDGPWQTIPGTVTIEGTGQPLRAITAKPKLVGY